MNCQQIPRKTNSPYLFQYHNEIKSLFTSRFGSEGVILQIDYSQLELRILAVVTQDDNLIDLYRSGVDMHKATASSAFGVPIEEVTKDMRTASKKIGFGIVYQESPGGLSADLRAEGINMSKEDCEKFIHNYFKRFPKVEKWISSIKRHAKIHKHVKSLTGRVRHLEAIDSVERSIASQAIRQAVNTPIQCVPSDSLILTELGYTKMEDISTTELTTVWTGKNWAKARRYEQTSCKNLVEISTEQGEKLVVSEDHKVYACTDSGLEWIQASKLKPGHFVLRTTKDGTPDTTEIPIPLYQEIRRAIKTLGVKALNMYDWVYGCRFDTISVVSSLDKQDNLMDLEVYDDFHAFCCNGFIVHNCSGSDCTLMSMIKMNEWLKETNKRTKMVITVHDSIVFDCPLDETIEVSKKVKHIMENLAEYNEFYKFLGDVPIVAELEIGYDYGTSFECTIEELEEQGITNFLDNQIAIKKSKAKKQLQEGLEKGVAIPWYANME